MGDNATEIDLDSVIDRLLEGMSLLVSARKVRSQESLGLSIEHILRTAGGILTMRA